MPTRFAGILLGVVAQQEEVAPAPPGGPAAATDATAKKTQKKWLHAERSWRCQPFLFAENKIYTCLGSNRPERVSQCIDWWLMEAMRRSELLDAVSMPLAPDSTPAPDGEEPAGSEDPAGEKDPGPSASDAEEEDTSAPTSGAGGLCGRNLVKHVEAGHGEYPRHFACVNFCLGRTRIYAQVRLSVREFGPSASSNCSVDAVTFIFFVAVVFADTLVCPPPPGIVAKAEADAE